MFYPISKSEEKRLRQQQASSAEFDFERFCKEKNISSIWLEKDKKAQSKFLRNHRGRCPDFLCVKGENQIFVEVKTHTLLTNEARNRKMSQIVQKKRSDGISGTTIFEPFDPRPELKGVFENDLKDTSKKFKNIKNENIFPRVLLLTSLFRSRIDLDIRAVFLGVYPSFYFSKNGEDAGSGWKKEHPGLFDSTGSNVSAVVYWNNDLKRYEGIANPRARIIFSEKDFKRFFGIPHV